MKKKPENPILDVIKSAQPVNGQGEPDKWGNRREGDFAIIGGRMFYMRKGRDSKKNGDKVYAILTANPTMADGVALFHADHNNLETAAALSVPSLGAARAAMRKQKGLQGAIAALLDRARIAGIHRRTVGGVIGRSDQAECDAAICLDSRS